MEFLQPWLHSGIVVAFQAEADVEPAGEAFAGGGDHRHVIVELSGCHPDMGRESIRQRAMAGEGDALEPTLECHGGILVRFAEGVFAQGRVAVGFVKKGCWHAAGEGWIGVGAMKSPHCD